jgi:hypothetical protein
MNIFIEKIEHNQISSVREIKRLFWAISKKIHPDVSSLAKNDQAFIDLRKQYEEALSYFANGTKNKPENYQRTITKNECIAEFIDLLANNFPLTDEIKIHNRLYLSRVDKINRSLNKKYAVKDIFIHFEQELLKLKGNTVISNHNFGVTKLYFYRYSDYWYQRSRINLNYLIQGYKLVADILQDNNMRNSLLFLNMLVEDIIERDKIQGDLPITAST